MALLVTVLLEERADRIIDRIAAAQCTRCTTASAIAPVIFKNERRVIISIVFSSC